MPWISGEYYIVCCHCTKNTLRGNARKDRTGLLACKKCRDEKDISDRIIPTFKDKALDARVMSLPTDLDAIVQPEWGTSTEVWGTSTKVWGDY